MLRNLICRTLPAIAVLSVCTSAHAAELTWSGFGSAFYAQSLNTDVLPYDLPNSKPNFTDYSLVGLNVNAKLADHWTAGAQLVASGDRSAAVNTVYATFGIAASWAHLTYTSDEGLQIRAGRQRFAVFTASEYIYEHYELPFREMPSIVFGMAPFVAFDGASVSQDFTLGEGKLNVQVFGGTPILSTTPASGGITTFSNLLGARVNYGGDGWRVRVQASRAYQSNLSSSNILSTANSSYYSAGYRYDKFNLVSWGEYFFRHAPDGTISPTVGRYQGSSVSGYILIGTRLNSWLPRYTFAKASSHQGISGAGTTTSHTIGVNYYFNPKVVAKAEYEISIIPNGGGGYKVTQPYNNIATSGGTLYAGLDFLM